MENKHTTIKGKVVYVIVSAASKMRYSNQIVENLLSLGVNVTLVPTPNAKKALVSLSLKKSNSLSMKSDVAFSIGDKNNKDLAEADAIIFAPATFNSVSKIASGIADNYALTLVATGISRKIPVILAPSYDTTWNHPLNQTYLDRIASWGVHVVYPDMELDHITMAPIQKIIDSLQARFNKVKFKAIKLDEIAELDKILEQVRRYYIEDFRTIGKKSEEDCINSGVNGFLSVRWEDWLLITATGSRLSKLEVEDLSIVSFKRSNKEKIVYWYGEKSPSSETPLNLSLYEQFPSAHAIAHTHCHLITYNPSLKPLKTDTYITYGEFENSKNLIDIIKNNGFGILRLHGEIAIGASIDEAYQKIRSYMPSKIEYDNEK